MYAEPKILAQRKTTAARTGLMTMPVEVLRRLEAAAKLEAEMAEEDGDHARAGANPLLDLARQLSAWIRGLSRRRHDDSDRRSAHERDL